MELIVTSSQTRAPASKASGLLLALLSAGVFACSYSASGEAVRGVFSLSPAGNTSREAVLANPNVDGISIRQDWKDLEPTEGVYDWSFLDSEVARASAAGKKVLLRINSQNKPNWVNSAVTEAGGTFITFDNEGLQTTIPVFWDPTFLAKKKAMIAALGIHFSSNSAIKIVCVSFANAVSEDWSVPHTPPDVANWFAVGYTSEKMLEAGKQIIDTTMAAFPNQQLTLAVAGNGYTGGTSNLDPDADYVARNAVLAARSTWPGRLIVQKNNLATFNPPAPGLGTVFQLLWDSRPEVGGQMLWNCFSDTTYRMNNGVADSPATILHKSVDLGVGYGMNYIEIYQIDVLNLPIEIAYAHNVLLGLSPLLVTPKPPTGLQWRP